ncbi:MAG: glycosyltransferase family 2 protein [Candidatus Gastranaerophilales bacterium]|nr:glycosyltransferase family 2 protein [Candidatus Gastranaerophilales bacterium]
MSISVIIHTYNSEKYLNECLESVKSADEIIICDMHSSDKTIEIAKNHGCKIIYHENVGFADPARNFAISHATSDWVFVVDSDEIIPEELWKYLREYITQEDPAEGVFIPRKNILSGKILWSWYPNRIQRFWKKGCVYWHPKVHEVPDTKGRVHYIDSKKHELAMIHYNYDNIESFIARTNKYTSLEVKKMLERGIKFSLLRLIFRPFGEFIKKYFLKKGYQDGMHGFIYSIFTAIYKFIAIAKLWEYEYQQKNKKV